MLPHSLVEEAGLFAFNAHEGQFRKYRGEPYYTHPAAVADLVRTVPHTDQMVAAALLHDVVEDTDITIEEIGVHFGKAVGRLVDDLTNPSKLSDGNRKVRKQINLDHTAKASPAAKTIKLADIIHNSESIIKYDPNFAKVYMSEKRRALEVLTEGDSALFAKAKSIIDDYWE